MFKLRSFWNKLLQGKRPRAHRPAPRCRLKLEALEIRTLLSSGITPILADVRGNGVLDVVETTTVRLGNGDGTFQPPITNPIPNTGGIIAGSVAGHFDGAQSPLDLVVLDLGVPDSGTITGSVDLQRGNGDGTFQAAIPLDFGGILPNGVVAGNFTHSGNLDLVVTAFDATTFVPRLELLRGNGNGTFQPPVQIPDPHEATIEAVADLNGDGNLDLVLGNSAFPNNLTVLLGNGDGTFQSPLDFSTGSRFGPPREVAVGHLRGADAPLDLVTANGDNPGTVSVLLGNGDGTFRPAVKIPIAPDANPQSVVLADFNGDGNLDIVTTNQFDLSQHASGIDVLFGNGDGTFQAPRFLRTDGLVTVLIAGDLNGDGLPDLITIGAPQPLALLNQGDGTFAAPAATATTLSADVGPSVVGQAVNLTATVSGGAGVPTGTVTFLDGTTVLGTAALDGTGTATLAVSFAAAGDHALTAVYSGQGASLASASDVLTETVNPAGAAVALAASVDSGVSGEPVTFTVTASPVAPGAGTPTGTVTLFDGDTVLGTAQLDENGQAVFTFALDAGDHRLTVSYGGDGNFQPGLSDPLAFPVT
jgi:hypothetical protein